MNSSRRCFVNESHKEKSKKVKNDSFTSLNYVVLVSWLWLVCWPHHSSHPVFLPCGSKFGNVWIDELSRIRSVSNNKPMYLMLKIIVPL